MNDSNSKANINTRSAGKEDREFLFALRTDAMKQYVEEIYGWDGEFQRAYFERDFWPEEIRIIQSDGVDVGMYAMVQDEDGYKLKRIEVLPTYQNRGIGTEILKVLLARADMENKPIGLRVFKINPAKRLYERLGFEVTGETETHYLLARRIPSS